jgi:hypothetical protein
LRASRRLILLAPARRLRRFRFPHAPRFGFTQSTMKTPMMLFRRSATTVVLTAMLPLSAAIMRGADSQSAAPAPKTPVPIVSEDTKVQNGLRALDQFLDVNPKMAELLQNNLDRIDQPAFIEQHPEWKEAMQKQPAIAGALKSERNFLLHRTLVRMTHAPVVRREIVQLDQFLATHPDIRTQVEKSPRLLADTEFLTAHPSLATFYQQHPGLSTILLQPMQEPPQTAKKHGEKRN